MTGSLLADGPPTGHTCTPPAPTPPPGAAVTAPYRKGAVWRCDCSRLWVLHDIRDRGHMGICWPWSLQWRPAGWRIRWQHRKASHAAADALEEKAAGLLPGLIIHRKGTP